MELAVEIKCVFICRIRMRYGQVLEGTQVTIQTVGQFLYEQSNF
jgi:hypothetical protein